MESRESRWHVALVTWMAGLHCIATRPSSSGSSAACDQGYYQRDPIVLKCQGGAEKSMLQLTEAGTAQSSFYWRAPKGTKDLQASFTLSAVHNGTLGLAVLEIIGKLDQEDVNGTLLNRESLRFQHSSSEWSWSGNPKNATAEHFKVWFRVNGSLDRDIEVHLINKFASRLHGYMEYSWAGISHCPRLRLGCIRCPEDYCGSGKTAHCNGGSFIECVSSPTTQLRTTTGLPVEKTTGRPVDKTTGRPPPPKMIEGLFDVSAVVGGGIDVTRQSFKDMVEACLAAALHIPLSAISRFRLVDVTSIVAPASSQGRLLQSHRDVILAVAYRMLLPRERAEELMLQLQDMDAGKSGLLASFTDILESHGVSVNGFKTVYPPTVVTKAELEAEALQMKSTSTAPVMSTHGEGGLSPMVSGIQSPHLPEDTGALMSTSVAPDAYAEPSWNSTQKVFVFSFAALLCAMGICFACSVLQALSARRSNASHLDHASQRRRGDGQMDRGTSEDRLLLDSADSPSHGGSTGFPSGYEPVNGQDGRRLLGDEGM